MGTEWPRADDDERPRAVGGDADGSSPAALPPPGDLDAFPRARAQDRFVVPSEVVVAGVGDADDDVALRRQQDEANLALYAAILADAVAVALGPWVVRCVEQVATTAGIDLDDAARTRIQQAAWLAEQQVVPSVRALLATDIDAQHESPLELVRSAVRYPTEVLRALGVPPVARDDFARAHFPDDDYGRSPVSWAEVDPSLAEPALLWGAAKAHLHLQRRRAAPP